MSNSTELTAQLQRIREWNMTYNIGTKVIVRNEEMAVTASEAKLHPDNETGKACVYVAGRGYMLLDELEPLA